jgi:Branched-chain amino acid transport system / permease component
MWSGEDPRRLAVFVLAACALAPPSFCGASGPTNWLLRRRTRSPFLALNLIAGQAGLISLGHGAFYRLGAYTLSVLTRHLSVSAYAAILAAGLVGLVTGYVSSRLSA